MELWGKQRVCTAQYLILLTLNNDRYEGNPSRSTAEIIDMLKDIREDAIADGRLEYEGIRPDGRMAGLLLGMERRGLITHSRRRWHIRQLDPTQL